MDVLLWDESREPLQRPRLLANTRRDEQDPFREGRPKGIGRKAKDSEVGEEAEKTGGGRADGRH